MEEYAGKIPKEKTFVLLFLSSIAKYTVDIELTYLSACHDRKTVVLLREENIIKTEIMIALN